MTDITTIIVTSFLTLGGGVITYLLAEIHNLKTENKKQAEHIDKLESLISNMLTGFVSIYAQSEDKSLSNEILDLVKQTQSMLSKIRE